MFFYLFTFAINLWHRKFVTAMSVNNQHGIQLREPHFDKTLKYTQNTQLQAYTGIKFGALKIQFVCIFFHVC